MSFDELGVAALGIYLLILVGVAEVARRARRGPGARAGPTCYTVLY